MTSFRLKMTRAVLRRFGRGAIRRAQDPVRERKRFQLFAKVAFRAPSGVTVTPDPGFHKGGEPALWLSATEEQRGRIILHLHGGGYLVGNPRTHWKVIGHLCAAAGISAFLPHYRLAPEHRLPAAHEDALAAWDHLIGLGFAPGDIILGGDSAGGGLALFLLAELGYRGQKPAGVYLWSPFGDLTYSGASVVENSGRDQIFPGERVHELPPFVLGTLSGADPRVSPIFATFTDPPPVFIQVSSTEILRDDALAVAERLKSAGAKVELEVSRDLPHVWHLFCGWFPEARQGIEKTADFLRSL